MIQESYWTAPVLNTQIISFSILVGISLMELINFYNKQIVNCKNVFLQRAKSYKDHTGMQPKQNKPLLFQVKSR